MLHYIPNVASFGLRCLKELLSGRSIVKEVPDNKACSVGSSDFFKACLFSAVNGISCSCEIIRSLGDHIHLCHRGNTGKSLSSESQGVNTEKIIDILKLAGGVSLESLSYLALFYATAVVCYTDHVDSTALYLNGNG